MTFVIFDGTRTTTTTKKKDRKCTFGIWSSIHAQNNFFGLVICYPRLTESAPPPIIVIMIEMIRNDVDIKKIYYAEEKG